MKKNISLIAIATLITFSTALIGCADSSDYSQKVKVVPTGTPEELVAAEDEAKRHADELLSSLNSGGQPGKLEIKGIIVTKDSEGELILDSRIKTQQIAGMNLEGKGAEVEEANKTLLSPDEIPSQKKTTDSPQSKKFLNFGCELQSTNVEGLIDESGNFANTRVDTMLAITAEKIFVCGKHLIHNYGVSFYTRELILKNADLSFGADGMGGGFAFFTSVVNLEGQNKISTSGIDDNSDQVPQGPGLTLIVSKELVGTGNLILETKGGNRITAISKSPVTTAAATTNSEEITKSTIPSKYPLNYGGK